MAHEHSTPGGQRHEEASSPVALQEFAQRLEVALSSAFPSFDDSAVQSDVVEPLNNSPAIDRNLLNVVPPPPPIDFDALAEESAHHRRILVQAGAVVSVAALISIGGALLYHALLVSILWFGIVIHPAPDAGGSRGSSASEGTGYLVADSPNATNTPIASPALAPTHAKETPDILPALPPVIQPLPSPDQLALNQINPLQPDLNIIAIPAGETPLGHLNAPNPRSTPPAPPPAIFSPPNKSDDTAAPVARVTSRNGNGAGGSGDDDEAPISWMNPGSGNGKEGSSGLGHGHIAGGDLPDPVPYVTPDLDIAIRSRPKHDHMEYKVTVAADGSITDVKLTESSGEADLDELWRLQILRNWKYHASHISGKYREATASVTIRLGPK